MSGGTTAGDAPYNRTAVGIRLTVQQKHQKAKAWRRSDLSVLFNNNNMCTVGPQIN